MAKKLVEILQELTRGKKVGRQVPAQSVGSSGDVPDREALKAATRKYLPGESDDVARRPRDTRYVQKGN